MVRQLRLSRIIILVLLVLVTVPLVTHYYLTKVASESASTTVRSNHAQLDVLDELGSSKTSDLKMRIEEMLRIKGSVSNELRDLESRRSRLQRSLSNYSQAVEDLKTEISRQQTELERLKVSVDQARVAQKEAMQHNTPELASPKRIFPSLGEDISPLPPGHSSHCKLHLCFDYSRCSLTSGFPVFVYSPEKYSVGGTVETYLRTSLLQTLGYNPHLTADPAVACLYLVLIGDASEYSQRQLELDLKKLPFWFGDGRNHLLLHVSSSPVDDKVWVGANTGRAMIAKTHFSQLRPGFDIVVPPILGPPGGDVWSESPLALPARRKYLLSFHGQYHAPSSDSDGVRVDLALVEMLKKMQYGTTDDRFFFQFICENSEMHHAAESDWDVCGGESHRAALLKESTYVLIIAPSDHSVISTHFIQVRLYEALKYGAIPVVLGVQVTLPFSDVIDWRKAAILLPKARITELHFLLRAVPDTDLLLMRRQGRLLWERYLASTQAVVDSVIAVTRDRVGVPALPVEDEPSPSVFNETFVPLKMEGIVPEADMDESLGPIEPPYPSITFYRNYSVGRTQAYEMWNEWADPFHLYPHLPFDPLLPSEAKFMGSGIGFRPIGHGAGGAGKEFSESLGGNSPREQFTIVMLTYEREQVLMNSLARLYGLPYLNKVIVVWNSPRPPPEDLRWPDIGVPVQVVKAARNSLNNRFLPYSAIETEAVLSVDDDAHLRHDEIMFGFRVWRENRNRLVGFPGRYHAWDLKHDSWLYNSNYSCELSMVLTGAAYFHKYYAYLYSYVMPQAIRDKVDEYMNCEDIAMNFLVSHVTQLPPVKVTSRWTFRCPGCPVSLSEEDSHFQERHKCINFFSQVFGYTPLLNTQFRADSILFKTRIPHDKQKCFKFI